MTVGARTEAHRTFLRMRQPIDEGVLPQPRVIEPGRVYRFPFDFIVPEQLLPAGCGHDCDRPRVRQAHLQLPPSLGDGSVIQDGNVRLDDMAPQMSRICYTIHARLMRASDRDGQDVLVAEGRRSIRIVPATEEDPPLQVEEAYGDGPYVLRRHKDLRKGLFKGRLGSLAIQAQQPRSLQLPPSPRGGDGVMMASFPASIMATVMVRFDPADESALIQPRLGQLVTRLRAQTLFSTIPARDFRGLDDEGYRSDRSSYSEAVLLSSRCVRSVRWERHASNHDAVVLADTADSNRNNKHVIIPAPTPSYRGGTFYTAKIVVPITLPKGKAFVPTFHSCLVSRVYTLEFSLAASTPGNGGGGRALHALSGTSATLSLRVPIQITSIGSYPLGQPTYDDDDDEETRQVEVIFQPRIISPPHFTSTETSNGIITGQRYHSSPWSSSLSSSRDFALAPPPPPPEYSFFHGTGQGTFMTIPSSRYISSSCG